MRGARGFLYARILHRIGHLPDLTPGINTVYMRGPVIRRPPLFHQQDGKRLPARANFSKKAAPFPGAAKEDHTDAPLMHNVCGRIGTELQQGLERIVDNRAGIVMVGER